MDADGVTLACATGRRAARRAARGLCARPWSALGARNGVPDGPARLVRARRRPADGLASGTVIDATRVVDERGHGALGGRAARRRRRPAGTILADPTAIVDDPAERRRLHERTGADAVDLESGRARRTGRLAGRACARSATRPQRPLGAASPTRVTADGRYDWRGLVKAFARAPLGVVRAAADARRALGALDARGEGVDA